MMATFLAAWQNGHTFSFKFKKVTPHPSPSLALTHPPSWALGITADGKTGQWFVLQIIKGREGKYVRTPTVLQWEDI